LIEPDGIYWSLLGPYLNFLSISVCYYLFFYISCSIDALDAKPAPVNAKLCIKEGYMGEATGLLLTIFRCFE